VHLKRLYLRGFKTFAEPVTLEFDGGITAIVGPNGVGKSNIVDGLLWALGEQSPRTLRTSSLQEVIFAGTEERRPLGMADVTVTLDNSDGCLPTEYVEVEITRRLFRNGLSEYLLNRRPARLKDIRELLLDTGLGPEAYSVVGQGQIEAILSVRPEDRRQLIEEAAGVRKYRVRRDEAQRRLESTRSEMQRLEDVMLELRAHIEPLEAEAARARCYRELDQRLRCLEAQLLAAEYNARRQRAGRLENDRRVAQEEIARARERLSAAEIEMGEVRRAHQAAQSRTEQLREAVDKLERHVAEVRQRRDVAHHYHTSIVEQLQAYQQTAGASALHRERLQGRIAALEGEIKAARSDIEHVLEQLATAEERVRKLEEQARLKVLEQEKRARFVASIRERITRAQEEMAGLQGLETELSERIERVQTQLQQMQRRREELLAQRKEIEAQVVRLRQAQATAAGEMRAAEELYRHSQTRLEEHRTKLRLVQENLAAVEAILRTIARLIQSNEGLSEASAAVMRASAAGEISGVIGPVASLIHIPVGLEAAIATVLGEKAQWIVVHDQAAARAAAEIVSRQNLGRLGLLILQELRPVRPRGSLRHDSGVVGWANELVVIAPELVRIVEHLLGNVLIVKDLATATKIKEAVGEGVCVATVEGQMISAAGEMVVGGSLSKQSPLLAHVLDHRLAQERHERILLSERRLLAMEERLRSAVEAAAQGVETARARLADTEVELTQAEGQMSGVNSAIEAAEQAAADLSADLGLLRSRLGKTAEQRLLASQTVQGLSAELQLICDAPAEEAVGDPREELEAAREEAVAAQIRVAQLKQRLEASEEEYRRTVSELAAMNAHVREAQQRVQELTQRLEEVNDVLGSLPEVEPLEQRLATMKVEAAREQEQAKRLAGQHEQLEGAIGKIREEIDSASAKMHQAELALAREETHLAALAERLQDQFGMTPEAASKLIDGSFNRLAAQREAEDIKEQIRALGPVNIGAPEELERLRARHDYLRTQYEDIAKARDELLDLIAELDEAAKEKFLRAFARVGESFARIFSRLFGGGETQLELTNAEEPLEGGVEIMVTPPGKRRQNMMLLSGGEKALTALAFVFALLDVRPSPFCVLDEIDAALDAASTDRFTELLNDFAQRSQFIVVTHNPQTIAAAQRLYGVTMQTPGVSMVLQVDLEEAQELAKTEPQRPRLRVTPAT
jgi:chromosome segregation protein